MKRKINVKGVLIFLSVLVTVALVGSLSLYYVQKNTAHRNLPFVPDYERVELTENIDFETIFLQTGIGKPTAEKLIAEGNFKEIKKAQDIFFTKPQTECAPMFGWFTREDRLGDSDNIPFFDLRTGDVLVTLSTHSVGWRHGHAGFVIDEGRVLECQRMGENSSYEGIYFWSNYTNWAVLRIKDMSDETQQKALEVAEDIKGTPYNILSGIIGPKMPDRDSKFFGLYCTNLVWYIWNSLGFDTDSDGGRIVTGYDILHSDKFEVVQIFGMDPREFL